MRTLMTLAISLSLLAGGCERNRSPRPRSAGPTTAVGPSAPQEEAVPCAPTPSALRPVGPSQSGAVVLARAPNRRLAIVADRDDGAVIAVDAERGLEVSRLELGAPVEHVLVASDGRAVASLPDRDRIAVLAWESAGDDEGFVARCSRHVAGEPSGMAMDGDRLLVASRWSAELHELDAATLTLRRTFPLNRDPYAVAIRQPGEVLVSHVVGGRITRVGLEDGRVEVLDASRVDHKGGGTPIGLPMPVFQSKKLASKKHRRKVPQGATIRAHRMATHGYAIAVASDGRAFVPASLADGSKAPSRTGYGGGGSGLRTHSGVTMVVNDESVVVPSGRARSLSTDCQLPRGAAWDQKEELLYVACRGVNAVHVYDQRAELPDRLVARIDVAVGPTGIALDPERRRLVVWSQFSGSLSATDLPTRVSLAELKNSMASIGEPQLVAESAELDRHRPIPEAVSRGRALFHAAGPTRRVAFDGRACASCHPDGRDDAITWATPEGPRQTPILMARLEGTAPFGWNGTKDDVQAHLDRTLHRLRGMGLSDEDREDILAYVGAMKPPRTAATEDESLVAQGAALYVDDEVGCASCHPTSASMSDGLAHELSPKNPEDRVVEFDTPSLRFVAQSAPYFHDGRYETIDALLADPKSTMGHSASLPAQDRRALKAYLQTL